MRSKFSRLNDTLNNIFWTVIFLFYSGVVFYFSVRPLGEGVPVIGIPGMDKLAHTGEFILFALIGYPAVRSYTKRRNRIVTTALISILYGSVTEFSQLFISYRSASILDWLANVAGTIIGLTIIFFYREYRGRKNG